MRLLNTTSYALSEFFDDGIPEYAILSHTWGRDEISFNAMNSQKTQELTDRAGFAKIKGCCERAVQDGFNWVWIDTCSINRDSSAELSEAINSMFRWYADSAICYAYLEDLVLDKGAPKSAISTKLAHCRWFRRGWTLQELIAPSTVEFFAADWTEVGSKVSLQNDIAEITRIPVPALLNASLSRFNVAERLSWAANRFTTRGEDRAYSLMGLFNVNMPMLYGEGLKRAFIRLQQEIMAVSEDYTIFVWSGIYAPTTGGMLASSPNAFSHIALEHFLNESLHSEEQRPRWFYRDIVPINTETASLHSKLKDTHEPDTAREVDEAPTPTGRGMRITLPMMLEEDEAEDRWLACLRLSVNSERQLICVPLDAEPDGQRFKRKRTLKLVPTVDFDKFTPMTIHVDWGWGEKRLTTYARGRVVIRHPKCISIAKHRLMDRSITFLSPSKSLVNINFERDKFLAALSLWHEHGEETIGYFEVFVDKYRHRSGLIVKTDRQIYESDDTVRTALDPSLIEDSNMLPDRVTERLLSGHTIDISTKRNGGTRFAGGEISSFLLSIACTPHQDSVDNMTEDFQRFLNINGLVE